MFWAKKYECIINVPFIDNRFRFTRTILKSWIRCFIIKISFRKKICSDIIYRYMCSNCKVTYYGKTYHHFFTRAAEHMGISNLTGKRLKCVKQSAVSDHLLECNCSIDFDHFDILASDANKFRLLIKESLLIKRDQPQLNKTIKSFPLKLFDWDLRW